MRPKKKSTATGCVANNLHFCKVLGGGGGGGDDPYHTTLSNVAKLPLKSGIIKKILLRIRFGEGFL